MVGTVDIGFHLFDICVRLTEEALFHPTKLYTALDQAIGVSKFDLFQQLGIYEKVRQVVGSQTFPVLPADNAPDPTNNMHLPFGLTAGSIGVGGKRGHGGHMPIWEETMVEQRVHARQNRSNTRSILPKIY